MQVICYNGNEFVEIEKNTPKATGHDLLIEIQAISVNPIDTKVKHTLEKNSERILGYDAAGVVLAVGDKVSLFKPGDTVFYAGDLTRDGSNATHQLVDERLVGHKPKTLSFAQAAALPLTSITAWESLFERLRITAQDQDKALLLIGAAGGVGSMAIQLAKQIVGMKVVATASRETSKAWCEQLGADLVIEHHNLKAQFDELNLSAPEYILCMGDPDEYFAELAKVVAVQGSICLLASAGKAHDINLLKTKSVSLVWELMFTRSMYQTSDMIEQHHLLNNVSELIDQNKLKTTLTQALSPINAKNLTQAHTLVEQGDMLGKVVISQD